MRPDSCSPRPILRKLRAPPRRSSRPMCAGGWRYNCGSERDQTPRRSSLPICDHRVCCQKTPFSPQIRGLCTRPGSPGLTVTLGKMPPAHEAWLHPHPATFLCGFGSLVPKSWVCLSASGQGDPRRAFLSIPPRTYQLPPEF